MQASATPSPVTFKTNTNENMDSFCNLGPPVSRQQCSTPSARAHRRTSTSDSTQSQNCPAAISASACPSCCPGSHSMDFLLPRFSRSTPTAAGPREAVNISFTSSSSPTSAARVSKEAFGDYILHNDETTPVETGFWFQEPCISPRIHRAGDTPSTNAVSDFDDSDSTTNIPSDC